MRVVFLVVSILLGNTIVFAQGNLLRGTVKVRKKKVKTIVTPDYKRVFSKEENPLQGEWQLAEYKIDNKRVSLTKNSHVLEFYDSSFHFRRIYSKPVSRIFEGSFPVNILRDKWNSAEDTIVKFKVLDISDYHLFYVEDSLVFTDLVEMRFEKFTYSPQTITFIVKEYDEFKKVIRTLFFRYRLLSA